MAQTPGAGTGDSLGRFCRYRCSTRFNYDSNLSICGTLLKKLLPFPDNRELLPIPKETFDLNLNALLWTFSHFAPQQWFFVLKNCTSLVCFHPLLSIRIQSKKSGLGRILFDKSCPWHTWFIEKPAVGTFCSQKNPFPSSFCGVLVSGFLFCLPIDRFWILGWLINTCAFVPGWLRTYFWDCFVIDSEAIPRSQAKDNNKLILVTNISISMENQEPKLVYSLVM